jgi:GTP-binding protein LepA
MDNNLEIIPIINKIDLPAADPERVKQEIEDVLGIPCDDIPCISAKTGLNVADVLNAIVERIPFPLTAEDDEPLKALIFDSYYDKYRGVMISMRIFEGTVKIGDKIRMMATGAEYEVVELGVKTPAEVKKTSLEAGEVGWLAASIRNVKDVHVGDTITKVDNPTKEPLHGYKQLNPMVYCGIYPIENTKYQNLKDALEKMVLSDSSLVYEPETSQSLGFGFRCGFLGLLHMDVIQERIGTVC